jgi:hypothetical protein
LAKQIIASYLKKKALLRKIEDMRGEVQKYKEGTAYKGGPYEAKFEK